MVFCNRFNISRRSFIKKGHNPYFNRWFSAIDSYMELKRWEKSHNPYFNRWFSAISIAVYDTDVLGEVTILILIDGFLQYRKRPIKE